MTLISCQLDIDAVEFKADRAFVHDSTFSIKTFGPPLPTSKHDPLLRASQVKDPSFRTHNSLLT